jgi:membrane-associated phospholipid phosphatase
MKRAYAVCMALAMLGTSLSAADKATIFPYSEKLDKASLGLAGITALMPVSLAFVCDGDLALPAATAYAEAMALTYVSKELLKKAFPRSRPYTYRDGALEGELLEEAEESFPSGHTALAFCAATSLATLAIEYAADKDATPWIIAGGYCFALGTGALRVASGCHYISDVAAGAVLGSGIGWLVTRANIRFASMGGHGRNKSVSRLLFTPDALLVNISF